MYEYLHQFGLRLLMRIVTSGAVRLVKRLIVVRLLEVLAHGIMAIQAELRNALGQVVIEFLITQFTGLMRDMASTATLVQRSVLARGLGNIHSHRVACKAEVLFWRRSFCSELQIELVFRGVRIVTLEAVTHCRLMHHPSVIFRVLVYMAGDAERLGGWGRKLYSSYVLVHPDFVTRCAAHLHCRMNMSAFRFIFVALNASFRGCLGIKGNRVGSREQDGRAHYYYYCNHDRPYCFGHNFLQPADGCFAIPMPQSQWHPLACGMGL